MKLKGLLPYIDSITTVRIYRNVLIVGEQYEVVFEGSAMDVPWTLIDCKLIETKDNEDSEAMCPYVDDKGNACLRITLGKDE
jgi:hypothetical protein